MKSLIKTILYYLFKGITYLLHFVYSYRLSRKIKKKMDVIYTLWIGNNIQKIGQASIIGRSCFLQGEQYIEIGNHSSINANGILTAWDKYLEDKFTPQIKIGDNCSIGQYCHITAINKIVIGNNVLTGKRVTITDNSHGNISVEGINIAPIKRNMYSKGEVIIEDNVWIGDNVTILPNVRIGYGAIIGANAVVTKDIPAYCVAGGNPVKIIKLLK